MIIIGNLGLSDLDTTKKFILEEIFLHVKYIEDRGRNFHHYRIT